ncbi:MAG: phosphopantetheine-binding protein [Gammaproteobacteria bacterium]|nr:phosphopantetheine-binding protein [Gammaproteobacteria bacterium]
MTPTEDRLLQLAREQLDLGHAPDLDRTFAESRVSSADAVSFLKVVGQEFHLSITAGDCVGVDSLRDLAGLVDAHSG